MPLKRGKSKRTIAHNIVVEIRHGKKPKQAVAIAYGYAHKRRRVRRRK